MAIYASVTDDPLDVPGVIASAKDDAAGAIATFLGTVRRSSSVARSEDKEVVALFYEAHIRLAEKRLLEIAAEATDRWQLAHVAITHRLGRCELGEPTVVIACSASHRDEAFDSCRWIIEELKTSVPIWKCEIYEEGSSWVGMGS